MTKQEERDILDTFFNVIGFNAVRIEDGAEPPDFFVFFDQKRIAIELRWYYEDGRMRPGKSKEESPFLTEISLRKKVLADAHRLTEMKDRTPVFVTVDWWEHNRLGSNQAALGNLAQSLAEVVLSTAGNEGIINFHDNPPRTFIPSGLQGYVSSMTVFRYPNRKNSAWISEGGAIGHPLERDLIQQFAKEKDSRKLEEPAGYLGSDESWLLLHNHGLTGIDLRETSILMASWEPIKTTFDKIYVVEVSPNFDGAILIPSTRVTSPPQF